MKKLLLFCLTIILITSSCVSKKKCRGGGWYGDSDANSSCEQLASTHQKFLY